MFWRTEKQGGQARSIARAARAASRHPYYEEEVERPTLSRLVVRLSAKTREADRRYRQLNAFIFQLAAEIEVRSEPAGNVWAVVTNLAARKIVLELGEGDDAGAASQLVAKLLRERGL